MDSVRLVSVGRLSSLAILCLSGLRLFAAPTIGTTAVTPTSIPLGVATAITVTSVIADTSVTAGSVNLQRLDSAGRVLTVLGILHDDGQNGDAVAGDHTFTLRLTLTEFATGPIPLRVSASFPGLLSRVFSGIMSLK